jgi:hypothetical protein
MPSPRRITAALALPAVAAAAFALTTGAEAQPGPAGTTLTFKELERGSTFTHVRNTKNRPARSNTQGDLIVFTNPLADGDGAVAGRLHAACVTTTSARDFRKSRMTCTGEMALRDGTLTFQGLIDLGDAVSSGAVTGGTGAYAGARGTFTSADGPDGALDTVVLAG